MITVNGNYCEITVIWQLLRNSNNLETKVKVKVVCLRNINWSGGATPAHGMSAKRVERVALGRLVLRPCVRASVRALVTRGPRNHGLAKQQ